MTQDPAAEIAKLFILIVEDEPFTRRMVMQQLRDLGVQRIIAADDGADALSIMQASETPFDLIISDLRMPRMDGFELVEIIRAGWVTRYASVPIVVMTAVADVESVERVVDSGIDGYVVKPISIGALTSRIHMALSQSAAARRAEMVARHTNKRGALGVQAAAALGQASAPAAAPASPAAVSAPSPESASQPGPAAPPA